MTGPAIRSTYTPERSTFNETVNHVWNQLKPKNMQENELKFNPFINVQVDEDHLEVTSHAKVIYAPKRFEVMNISIMRVETFAKDIQEVIKVIYQPNIYNERLKTCIEAHDNMTKDDLIGWLEEKTGIKYHISE